MTHERWEDLQSTIKDRFDLLEEGREDFDPEEGGGFLEYVIFVSPLGEMKLELEVKPRVIDRHVIASRRAGSHRTEKFVYSENENVITLFVFRWNEAKDDWDEMDVEAINALASS